MSQIKLILCGHKYQACQTDNFAIPDHTTFPCHLSLLAAFSHVDSDKKAPDFLTQEYLQALRQWRPWAPELAAADLTRVTGLDSLLTSLTTSKQ